MVKFDLHIHSCYSKNLYGTKILCPPSKSTPRQIIDTAIGKGIGVIAVTDHDNIKGSLETLKLAKKEYNNQVIVCPGVEVSSKDGHIIAYNVYEDIPKNLSAEETIAIIKRKGGLAVAAHPFNVKYSIKNEIGITLMHEFFAFEASNSHSLNNRKTREFVDKNNLAYTAGSDAHSLSEIGLCYGETGGKITNIDEFLDAIKNKNISNIHTYDKRLIQRVVPGAIESFFYWKTKQVISIFDKRTFLPYSDDIG